MKSGKITHATFRANPRPNLHEAFLKATGYGTRPHSPTFPNHHPLTLLVLVLYMKLGVYLGHLVMKKSPDATTPPHCA